MAITSQWTIRNFGRITRGTSNRYKEIMRITQIEFMGYTLMDQIAIASLAYCRMAAGQEHSPYHVADAFRLGTNSSWGNGKLITQPAKSDQEKRFALRAFYDQTKPSTWDNWRQFMASQGVA